jgi:hypothetical protein
MRIQVLLLTLLALAAFGHGAAFAEAEKGSVTGRVVDKRGRAIAGARVSAAGDEEAAATTEKNGEFRLELEPGQYRLQFEADGYSSATLREPVTVEAGRQTKLKRRVELPESDTGTVVRGSVFDELGRSIAGAKVVLERIPGADGQAVSATKMDAASDSMGLFAFRLPAGSGRYRLTATHPKFKSATVTVDVAGGEILNAPPLKLSAT